MNHSSFSPIAKLDVWRTLNDGAKVHAGTLAQNQQAVYFQYNDDYLARFSNLSPFKLTWGNTLQAAPSRPHYGLHGTFADSLPDGWGLLLMDRVFRQHAIAANNITAMDRLAFVGTSAMGGLSYAPNSDYTPSELDDDIDLHRLGLQAQALFDGQTEEVLASLVAAGSSGGARPKAQVYFQDKHFKQCRAKPQVGDQAWLVKFTSGQLALGHEEGLCEAAYLSLAKSAGLNPPDWQLLPAPAKSGADYWLAVKRFDWVSDGEKLGRRHMHSACGLLGADFRTPSLDYSDLIKASSMICQSPVAGQMQFKRAIFNLFALNQDDHSKNWAFLHDADLQNPKGSWSLAPFYDVTFSPNPYAEHATAFSGYGKKPPLKIIQQLASTANFANWKQAQQTIEEVVTAISQFTEEAEALGVRKQTIALIEKQLNQVYRDNATLIK